MIKNESNFFHSIRISWRWIFSFVDALEIYPKRECKDKSNIVVTTKTACKKIDWCIWMNDIRACYKKGIFYSYYQNICKSSRKVFFLLLYIIQSYDVSWIYAYQNNNDCHIDIIFFLVSNLLLVKGGSL